MAENSKIQWTHHTHNPWRGCTKISPGCTNCYADTMSKRNPSTLGVWGPKGTRVVAAEAAWREPLKWNRLAKSAGERHRVFCASLADVFEDWKGPMAAADGRRLLVGVAGDWCTSDVDGLVPAGFRPLTMADVRMRLFKLIASAPSLDWLLLTKRPQNALDGWPIYAGYWAAAAGGEWPHRVAQDFVIPNVWVGVSVEDQKAADERIPLLLKIPAAVRFLSCEPLLGPLDLRLGKSEGVPTDSEPCRERADLLHWVIAGGESGHGARPCDLAWIRSIVQQCETAGVACFVKQLGAVPHDCNDGSDRPNMGTLLINIKDKKGGDMAEWPADLRVRQFPSAVTA